MRLNSGLRALSPSYGPVLCTAHPIIVDVSAQFDDDVKATHMISMLKSYNIIIGSTLGLSVVTTVSSSFYFQQVLHKVWLGKSLPT